MRASDHRTPLADALTEDVDPERLRSILLQARVVGDLGPLFTLYRQLERSEDRYGGVLNTFYRAITSRRARLEPARGRTRAEARLAARYRDVCEAALQGHDLDALKVAFARAYHSGAEIFSASYVERQDPRLGPIAAVADVERVPYAAYAVVTGDDPHAGELALWNRDGTTRPLAAYDDRRVFAVTDGDLRGEYHEAGVARRALAWYVIKTWVARWWAEVTEIYNEPFRKASYAEGTPDDLVDELEAQVARLGRRGYAVLPEGVEIDFINAVKSGEILTHEHIIAYADNSFAVTLLGQNKTTDGGSNGSYALASVHEDVKVDVLQAGVGLAERGFDRIFRGVLRVTFGDDYRADLVPRYRIVVANPTELSRKAQAYGALMDRGVPILERQIREEFALEDVEDGDPVVVAGRRFENVAAYVRHLADADRREEEASRAQADAVGQGGGDGEDGGDEA